jgi:hypothetical protein
MKTNFDPLLAFILTFVIFAPFSLLGVDAHHDGIMFKTALDVASGQTLFKDTFTQYGALTVYLQAAALLLFGKSVATLKLLTVFFYAASAATLVAVWRHFLPRALVALSVMLWLILAPFYSRDWILLPWASVPALLFQSLSLLFLVRSVSGRGSRMNSVLAGACAGLVTWCRTPAGVLLFLALLCSYIYAAFRDNARAPRAWKGILGALLGFLLVNGIFAGILLSQNSFREWYFQSVEWPRLWASNSHAGLGQIVSALLVYRSDFFLGTVAGLRYWLALTGFATLLVLPALAIRRQWTTRVLLVIQALLLCAVIWASWDFFRTIEAWGVVIPLFIVAAAAYDLFRPSAKIAFVATGIVSLASWAQYYPIPCPRHLYWSITPAVGCFVFILYRLAREHVLRVAITVALLAAPLLFSRTWQARLKFQESDAWVGQAVPPLAGLRLSMGEIAYYSTMYRMIHDYRPGASTALLLEGPDALLASFASNLQNFSPFYVDWPGVPRSPQELAHKDDYIRELKPLIYLQREDLAARDRIRVRYGYEVLVALGNQGWILHPR